MKNDLKNLSEEGLKAISVSELQKRAEQNDAAAFWELGNREAEEKNAKAVEYWQKAAELGYVEAHLDLGLCYQYGEGVRKNAKKAIEHYEKGIALGHVRCLTNLGYLYETKKDYAKAKEFYEKAAEFDEHMAINNLGWLYENGFGVPNYMFRAIEYYTRSAELGNKNAMQNLLNYYITDGDRKNTEIYYNLLYKTSCTYSDIEKYALRLFDGITKDYEIKPDDVVLIGTGNSTSKMLQKFYNNRGGFANKRIIAVAVNCDMYLMQGIQADIRIFLDNFSNNEWIFSIPAKYQSRVYAKLVDFIKHKLNKNQKIVVVGHGGGYSAEIFRHVLCELKNNGHSFRAIMPTPFSFESDHRKKSATESLEFLKEKGINVDTFDYNDIPKRYKLLDFDEAFYIANIEIANIILNTLI